MVDHQGQIVFVEVKTRADEDYASAESAITDAKKHRLSLAAKHFLSTYNITNRPYRFDVVAVILGKAGPIQIRHYENAFVR